MVSLNEGPPVWPLTEPCPRARRAKRTGRSSRPGNCSHWSRSVGWLRQKSFPADAILTGPNGPIAALPRAFVDGVGLKCNDLRKAGLPLQGLPAGYRLATAA